MRHREGAQLGRDRGTEAFPGGHSRAVQLLRHQAQLGDELVLASPQFVDTRAVAVKSGEPGDGVPGPGEDAVHVAAVCAAQPRQRSPALLQPRQPPWVSLYRGPVTGEVCCRVGKLNRSVLNPVGELVEHPIMSAGGSQLPACRAQQAECRRTVVAVGTGEHPVRAESRRAQTLGVFEPGQLTGHLRVLSGAWVDPFDLSEPDPQQLRLTGAFLDGVFQPGELASHRRELFEGSRVAFEQAPRGSPPKRSSAARCSAGRSSRSWPD